MKDNRDQEFTSKITEALDRSVENIDEKTRYRLQLARANVLNGDNQPQPWYKHWHTWATATGLASICTVALLMTGQFSVHENSQTDLTSAPQASLYDDEASLDLYEEYDFYVWLSHQEINS
jgi:hypothetical protein